LKGAARAVLDTAWQKTVIYPVDALITLPSGLCIGPQINCPERTSYYAQTALLAFCRVDQHECIFPIGNGIGRTHSLAGRIIAVKT
jgi:hypothetical protein